MKAIIYRSSKGNTCIVRPALGARLCVGFTLNGELVEVEWPVMFDRLAVAYGLYPLITAIDAEGFPYLDQLALDNLNIQWTETEDEFIDRLRKSDVPPAATNVSLVEEGIIPLDRTFRNALNPDLTHDLAKCRAIWRDKMRLRRIPLLAALDAEYMKADEVGDLDTKRQIASRKQELRDVTSLPGIDAAQTPEELKTVWPRVFIP